MAKGSRIVDHAWSHDQVLEFIMVIELSGVLFGLKSYA